MNELEKMKAVQERSQAVGEFLDWLQSKKQIVLAKYVTEELPSPQLWPPYHDNKTYKKTTLQQEFINIEKSLAEFFGIDLEKAEKEKRKILEQLRATTP